MRLLIYSDLHNEFQPFVPPAAAVAAADVVVLAGDIHEGIKAVTWAQEHCQDKPVIMVAGNHEFFGGRFYRTLEKMREATVGTNIHLLEDDAVTIDGVRFLGCTLWTDMKIYGLISDWQRYELELKWPDYRKIRNDRQGYRRLLVRDTVARHQASRAWLEQQLAQPFDGKTVVVTHHLPTEQSVSPQFRGDRFTRAFASEVDALIRPPVDLWIHGHTHDSMDYRHQDSGVRIVCNPCGYLPEEPNRSFRAGELWVV